MNLALGECSDGELAALAIAGRQSAYAELLSRHREAIFRMVRGTIGDADAAIDVTQEAFIAAFAAHACSAVVSRCRILSLARLK